MLWIHRFFLVYWSILLVHSCLICCIAVPQSLILTPTQESSLRPEGGSRWQGQADPGEEAEEWFQGWWTEWVQDVGEETPSAGREQGTQEAVQGTAWPPLQLWWGRVLWGGLSCVTHSFLRGAHCGILSDCIAWTILWREPALVSIAPEIYLAINVDHSVSFNFIGKHFFH